MFSLLEYIKIHRISLQQDLDKAPYADEFLFYKLIQAKIEVLDHLIKVAEEIE